MGGSAGSGAHGRGKTRDLVKEAGQAGTDEAFEAQLSDELAQLLSSYNDRDAELVRDRLDEIIAKVEDEIAGHLDTLYGGSMAKHTYVDGLSDIDTMLLVDKSDLAEQPPEVTLTFLRDLLADRLSDVSEVSSGDMAVTVKYEDGMELQLLPALRTPGGLRVSNPAGRGWAEIAPDRFREALTACNQRCSGLVVPTIKLVKAINDTLPSEQRPKGYHIESLAIESFKRYEGPKTYPDMLRHFFDRAKDLVKTPIADRTGQSLHVDDHMGPKDSPERAQASHVLGSIARRMAKSRSLGQWLNLFGE